MRWERQSEKSDVLDYCATLQNFLLENLWEEEVLIAAYALSHIIH
jgi:hypothetical protein